MVGPVTFELLLCISQAFMSDSLLGSGHVWGDLFLDFKWIKPPSSMRSLARIAVLSSLSLNIWDRKAKCKHTIP